MSQFEFLASDNLTQSFQVSALRINSVQWDDFGSENKSQAASWIICFVGIYDNLPALQKVSNLNILITILKLISFLNIFGHSIDTIYVVLPKRSFCWRAMINEAAFFIQQKNSKQKMAVSLNNLMAQPVSVFMRFYHDFSWLSCIRCLRSD